MRTASFSESRLEEEMKKRGISHVGDSSYREKNKAMFEDSSGEIRMASLDMNEESRALRTLAFRRLTQSDLESIHDKERMMGRFFGNPFAVALNYGAENKPLQMSEDRISALVEFNNKRRPEMRTVFGIRVPPYFKDDMEFDGMEYHHAWDKAIMFGDFELPDLDARRSAKEFLR